MVTIIVIVYLILMHVRSQVSGQDSNCPQNCTLVNIAASNFKPGHNNNYTTTGQAAWVTDGVTSGQCASVSSIFPAWQAEFKQNRTVSRIKIFWEDQQDDVYVSVGGRICHTPNSSYIWKPEYTLDCDVPVTGDHLLVYRQPTVGMLNLSFCEVEIYAVPEETSMSFSTTTTMPTTSKTLSTTKVTTSPSTAFLVTMSTTGHTSSTMTTPPTATTHPSETSTPPSGEVSGQDSNYPHDCTLVNITASYFTSLSNNDDTTTGQAAWVTDRVTSGPCASVSSSNPAWKAEFGQNRTVTRIKIFWEETQDDVIVSVGGRICHTPDSSYTWEQQYTLECDVAVTGNNLLIYREPNENATTLNLSFCEVEIYAKPIVTSSSMCTSTTTAIPTKPKTLSTPTVTTSSITSSTASTASGTSMDDSTTSLPSTQPPLTSGVMSSTVEPTTTTSMTKAKPTTSHQISIVTSTAAPVLTETSTTSQAKPTIESPGADTESPDSRFPLLYVIVVGVVVAGVVTVAVVAVVCVRRQKGTRPQAKDADEAVMSSYEECIAEPFDHTRYQNIQSHRTPRGWSGQGSIYANTTTTTSLENINENECTYVNNEYINDQNVSTGTSCYINVGSNNQDIGEVGESNMYVNTTDFSLYENTLNVRT